MITTILALVVGIYALIGIGVSGYSVLLDSGIVPASLIVDIYFARRIAEVTGRTPDEHFKGIGRRARLILAESIGSSPGLPWIARDWLGRARQVPWFLRDKFEAESDPTGREIVGFLRKLRQIDQRFFYEDSANNLFNLLPYCSETSNASFVKEGERMQRLARSRATRISFQARVAAKDAETLNDLYRAYHRWLWSRRLLAFEAVFGLRRIWRGRGPRQIVYWKRLLTYVGKGGGVGTVISYAVYWSPVAKFLPFPVVGGTFALIAFTAKALTYFTKEPSAGPMNNRAYKFAKDRPLLAAAAPAAIAAVALVTTELMQTAGRHFPAFVHWIKNVAGHVPWITQHLPWLTQ